MILDQDKSIALLKQLKERFEKHGNRHEGITWETVQGTLEGKANKLWSLYEMERTGGEPDVIGVDPETRELLFVDCSPETPKERRSLCYDQEALASRKEHKPKTSAVEMAAQMGIELLTEDEYRDLQKLEAFDLKTSSWVKTPKEMRELGGALFCDRRYNRVFAYHNGAESYYGVRGFRGILRV